MSGIGWLLVAAAIIVGFTLGWARSKQLLAGAVPRRDYDALMQEKTALATKLDVANGDLSKLTEFHERALTAEAEKRALEQRLKEQQELLRTEFKNTATVIFDDMSKKFSTHSEKQIGNLLTPMQQRLNEFKELVVNSFTTQGKEQHTLKSEIEKIVLQTDSLTKALRGDVKAQGNWGEVMLERILEESGLRKGEDYIVQGAEMGLAAADGSRQQPDVIVMLPDDKHIIIDAKMSLTAYERYCVETDETARLMHLKDFLKSVRAHVVGLEARRYQDNEKLSTPDLVFLFMPIEGAFSFALQHDRELHSFAWGRKIVIVSPTMLFANLRTIASLWRIETQNRHAQEIARQGGALYDKFVGFVEDMQSIGTQVARTQKTYDDAMSKLVQGKGNLISRAENLKTLGVKSSKSLPKDISGTEESTVLPIASMAEG